MDTPGGRQLFDAAGNGMAALPTGISAESFGCHVGAVTSDSLQPHPAQHPSFLAARRVSACHSAQRHHRVNQTGRQQGAQRSCWPSTVDDFKDPA